jgi:cytochrome c
MSSAERGLRGATWLLAAVAWLPASAEEALARKNGCLGCHAINEKVLGPSFVDVAKRYAGKPDAADSVARSIVAGAKGAWGSVPMPPNPQLTAAEAAALTAWVLAQSK